MDGTTVVEQIISEVRSEIDAQKETFTGGQVKDYPTYREHVGIVRGLRHVETFLVDMHARIESY
jgi:hypothetical protein